MDKPRLGPWEPDGDGGIVAYVLDGATGTLRTRGAVIADVSGHEDRFAFDATVFVDRCRAWEGTYAADEFALAQEETMSAAERWYEVARG